MRTTSFSSAAISSMIRTILLSLWLLGTVKDRSTDYFEWKRVRSKGCVAKSIEWNR